MSLVAEEAAWRVVPEFPKYAISTTGVVVHIETGKPRGLHIYAGKKFVSLRKDNRKRYSRSVAGLLRQAFPDKVGLKIEEDMANE